jgi:hypothetical protein
MVFECIDETNGKSIKWTGRITEFKNYGSHYEIKIVSRSSILVLFGKTTQGAFACMPDFEAGCHLVDLRDIFWNTERLVKVMGEVDGITVAYALKALADKINY